MVLKKVCNMVALMHLSEGGVRQMAQYLCLYS